MFTRSDIVQLLSNFVISRVLKTKEKKICNATPQNEHLFEFPIFFLLMRPKKERKSDIRVNEAKM